MFSRSNSSVQPGESGAQPVSHSRATDSAPPSLREAVIEALRTVDDPELGVNIYDLGLVYHLDTETDPGRVAIRMTLTAPGCPVAQTFPDTVRRAVEAVPGVEAASVELVWDPPWSVERVDKRVRFQLGLL